MLLHILATWPFPASPQCTIRLPMCCSTGLPRSKACVVPPTINVSVAALAPPTPPDTGASSVAIPFAAASLCALRALSTSIVEQSMNNVPCRACWTISFHTESTCCPAGSMVTMTSASSTALLVLATISTASWAAASREAATRSKPRTRFPAFSRLAAIGPPILPRPINPIFDIVCLVHLRKLQLQRADGLEVALDDIRRDIFKPGRLPSRVAILVDDGGADTFDEIVSGVAGQHDTVILLEALLNALERRRLPYVLQRDLERRR